MEDLTNQLETFKGAEQHALIDDFGNPVTPASYEPTQEELNQPYAAPGEAAHYPEGLVFQGDWKSHADGMARHVRATAKAMACVGLPIKLEGIGRSQLLDNELHPDVQPVAWMAQLTFSEILLSIKQAVFSSPDTVVGLLVPPSARFSGLEGENSVAESTVIYTSWERDKVHPAIVDVLNRAAEVWVPCLQNWEAFKQSGVRKVAVIPYAYDPEEHTLAFPRGSDKTPSGKRFYSIGKWEPRKNQHGLVGAFLLAFKQTDKASLYIKTNPFGHDWANYPSPDQCKEFWLSQPAVQSNGWTKENLDKRLKIVTERLSDLEIQKIHERSNIYVSSSRGEAVNIPAFEAKLAGNAMVYVKWGGPTDFAEDTDVAVDFTLRPVHPGYKWPEKDACWAEAKVQDLKEALLRATPKTTRCIPSGMYRGFSIYGVGSRIRRRLQDIRGQRGLPWL